jgi:glycosyltransferase involved in cell wall biosynthesis
LYIAQKEKTMSERPKVSYVCSVKDGAKDIERCAASVLGQSVREIELILVDDHSKDTTWELIQHLSGGDNRVRGVRNQGMEGLTYSLNMGIDFARGEFVARIDVDDFAHRNRTERQLAVLESHPDAVMCASCFRQVDERDWELYCHCPSCDTKLLKWSLCFRNNIRHSTAMWRRSLDVRYEPAFPHAQDYDLWCRISRMGDIAVLPEIVSTIRSRASSITSTKHEQQERMADRVAAEQYERYTGARMRADEARHLRMIHHMKSPEQFKVFENMTAYEFSSAVERYCRLAEAFRKKESPDEEAFVRELGHDIRSLMGVPSRRRDAAKSVRQVARLFGVSSLAERMDREFVRPLEDGP